MKWQTMEVKWVKKLAENEYAIQFQLELSQKCRIPPHSALSQNRCHVIGKKNHGSALTA